MHTEVILSLVCFTLMRGNKPGCAEIMWSVQIKSPGPLILFYFLMEEGLAFDLHERILYSQ